MTIRLLKDPTTPQQQEDFAAFMRARIPKPKGQKLHDPFTFTEYASKVLGRPVSHWRGLTSNEFRQIKDAADCEFLRSES